MSSVIERWHKVVEAQDPSGLADLLAGRVGVRDITQHLPIAGSRFWRPAV